MDVLLQHRLAAGDLNERQFVSRFTEKVAPIFQLADDVVDAHRFAALERINRIAVGAAQIAAGQPDKGARQPSKGTLALNAEIYFVNQQRLVHGYEGSARGSRLARRLVLF